MTYTLVYRSVRVEGLADSEVVDGIVLPTLRRNRELDVTGCLWVGDRYFFQVLEGDEADVRSLYEKIEQDERHHTVELLTAEKRSSRQFDRFAMKLIKGSDADELWAVARELPSLVISERKTPPKAVEKNRSLIDQLISTLVNRPETALG